MKTYLAILASIIMLATTAAFGRARAAPPTGVSQTAVYVSPAAQHRIDGKTLNPMQTPATFGAPVVLTAGRGGGGMHGGRGSLHAFQGRSFGGGSFRGGLHRDFDRGFHRDFDRDFDFHHGRHFFIPRHRDFDDFNFGFSFGWPYYYYPYGYGYYPYWYYYPYGYYPYWDYYPDSSLSFSYSW